MNLTRRDENLAYHAARLLILISLCGKPRSGRSKKLPGIEGRTLLAKLDFFLRYPTYLKKATEILEKELSDEDLSLTLYEVHSVESRMVRYLYGPWDHIYYPALAYLVGKELITIESKKGVETFRLTLKGKSIASDLAQDPVYTDLARRADTTYHLFNRYTGNRLKDFIYKHFPEVVSRKLGETI
jgi:hypothetical protein